MLVLNAENLTKVYKGKDNSNNTNALNGINIKIERGEFVGIMGPSGSGKTTLLNILSGIDKATAGDIHISGKSINKMKSDELALFRRKHLGFVFQEFNLLDSLTLEENVVLPMILDKREPDEIENKAKEVMSLLDIEEIMKKYPYSVSGGQQQRAAICRAIVNEPDIIFADEPTGNLDSKSSNAVMRCFEKLNSVKQSTILTVTHDPFAASYCNRIVFIKDGFVKFEINKTKSNKEFLEEILDCVANLGGEKNDDL